MSEFETVGKWGGSSMREPTVVASILEQRPDIGFVVVSAPGILPGFDQKMTDVCMRYGDAFVNGRPEARTQLTDIVQSFDELYSSINHTDRKALRSMVRRYLTPSYGQLRGDGSDYFAAQGELFSARYFAQLIGATAISPAIRFSRDGRLEIGSTNAEIAKQLAGLKKDGRRQIVPGFYGTDDRGIIHLLGRGGSDRTQALYGSALGLDCENWTDVDGIFSTDSRQYTQFGESDPTRLLKVISRDEVREGAHGGSGVLQGNAILDLNGSDVVVTVRNTFNPDAPGTRVVAELSSEELSERGNRSVVAVSGRDDLIQVGLRDLGMADREGYVNELLSFLASQRLPFEHMPASQDSVAFTMHADQGDARVEAFEEFARNHRLSQNGKVVVQAAGVVYVVGEGLRDTTRFDLEKVTARCLMTAVANKVHATPVVSSNISGVNSPSVAFLTNPGDVVKLVKAIHRSEIEG